LSWLIPALKAVLPHVGDIVAAAKPVFTKKKPDTPAAEGGLVQQQIAELQGAVAQNAAHIRELAEQLQRTVAALEQAAAAAEQRLRRAVVFCAVATAVSVLALGVAALSMLLR
jgi:hypothetical protein